MANDQRETPSSGTSPSTTTTAPASSQNPLPAAQRPEPQSVAGAAEPSAAPTPAPGGKGKGKDKDEKKYDNKDAEKEAAKEKERARKAQMDANPVGSMLEMTEDLIKSAQMLGEQLDKATDRLIKEIKQVAGDTWDKYQKANAVPGKPTPGNAPNAATPIAPTTTAATATNLTATPTTTSTAEEALRTTEPPAPTEAATTTEEGPITIEGEGFRQTIFPEPEPTDDQDSEDLEMETLGSEEGMQLTDDVVDEEAAVVEDENDIEETDLDEEMKRRLPSPGSE